MKTESKPIFVFDISRIIDQKQLVFKLLCSLRNIKEWHRADTGPLPEKRVVMHKIERSEVKSWKMSNILYI